MSKLPPPRDAPTERLVLDGSVLLGNRRRHLFAATDLSYYLGYWSSWIFSEFVRKRTEWIARRAVRDGCDLAELDRRLRESRGRVNALIDGLSGVLRSVGYPQVPREGIDWLRDPDDWPIMRTALAAQADTLVTDNARDFPLGEERNGILILGSEAFLTAVYSRFPDAETAIHQYLQASHPTPHV